MFEFLRKLVAPAPSTPEPKRTTAPADVAPAPLTAAMNTFALDVWRRLPADDALFSPGSLWLALAMTTSGARGETRAQLARLLRLPDGDGAFDASVTKQLAAWNVENPGEGLTLRTVNRLFGQDAAGFEAAWLGDVERVWLAAFEKLVFEGDEDAARRHVNAWVARQTEQKIRELLPPNSVTRDTRLVLINAVYFLAKWINPFPDHLTEPAPFFSPSGERSVSMMRKFETLSYVEFEGAQVVSLPYEGGPLELVLVLPQTKDGLPVLEQGLTPSRVEGWLTAATHCRVELMMPKFKLEPAGSLALKQTLQALGVELAFDRERADFTAMANPPRPDDRLYVSDAFHQAFMRVDEQGTEAAAATAVVMARAGSAPRMDPPKVFRADHPFLLLLRDSTTGAWLFMGRVVSP